jgi:hypothetical protein
MELIVNSQRVTLNPGEVITIGKKMYSICARCGKLVRVDKPLLGSLHFC